MSESIEGADEQALQHFLSNANWSYRDVMDKVARDASSEFEGKPGTCLLIDESAIEKKGEHSAGVKRQWNGRLGKVDNCQVGVFAALSRGRDTTLIDGELFLPECWAKDNKRCAKAKIPKEKRVHRSKIDMALEIVWRAKENNVKFEWVGADSLYGRNYNFAMTLDEWQETFVLDIPGNYHIYEEDPKPKISEKIGKTGRPKTKYVTQAKSTEVATWLNKQSDSDWRIKQVRKGSKGLVKARILHKSVWVWDGKSSEAYKWHLICRTNLDGGELKYSISNAPAKTSTKKLAYMQSQRHFVERAFQDGKSELGMAQYQARSWEAWHRHMSIVMMAMLFVVKKKAYMRETFPFVTVSDIVVYFAVAIPDKKSAEAGMKEILHKRNEKRRQEHERLYGDAPPCHGLYS